jgi:hypothetical protein
MFELSMPPLKASMPDKFKWAMVSSQEKQRIYKVLYAFIIMGEL